MRITKALTILRDQSHFIWRMLRISFGLGIGFLLCQISLDTIESLTYDTRFRLKPTSPVSDKIVTIAVGVETIEKLQRDPNAFDNVKILEQIREGEPLAVVYVLDPGTLVGSYEELEKFAKTAETLPFYVAGSRLQMRGLENENLLPAPLDHLPIVPAPGTIDARTFGKDNVTRRLIFSFQGRQTLHPILASRVNGKSSAKEYRGVFDFYDSEQAFIDFKPRGTYRPYQFVDVLEGLVQPKAFKNKIVLIGRDNQTTSKDYVQTPFTRDLLGMSTLEMHANIIDTLILDRAPVQAPEWLNLILTSLISVLTVFVVLTVRPAKGLIIIGATLATFSLVGFLLLYLFRYTIDMAHPLLAIFISYYFFIPYRLIMENRKSWEYFQRNKLLTQVEELKSNFLKMMSHDLKTPLARIQGMADMVLRDRENLSSSQQAALKNISQSSDELSQFIASILNFGRIESKEIKLQLHSKDVNSLLRDVSSKLSYLAASKNIEVILELEPLFSVKIDEDLIRQVFTNLVENAIKYSLEGSKVLITTEEIDGRLLIQVADQGIGIPKDELENIFSKFYRSRTVADSNVKGTGLGLYLSQYFIRLHRGKISVESEQGKGSTFTVELPMNLDQIEQSGKVFETMDRLEDERSLV